MIRTLTGENSFGLKQELDKRMAEFIKEHGDLALEKVDGAEVEIERIQEALTSLPFLASKKMVVLRTAGANKKFSESAAELLAGVPETTDVIIVEPKLDKRSSYYKFLKGKTEYQEFNELDGGGLARWLTQVVKDQGGELSLADANYLVERVGANQQLLSKEIEKLILYNPKVSRQSIELLVEPTPQSTIFQLLEAAFAGSGRRAMELYAEQRALKVEPQQIIAMLAWQLHVLAVVKAAGGRSVDDISREARLNPFVVRKTQGVARGLSLVQIKKLISDLLTIDRRLKIESIDADEILKNYLINLGQIIS